MLYRARNTTAPSAWISDDRGRFTFDGKIVCAGFYRYKGFCGCPQWAIGKPCTYCYLATTFARNTELRSGVAWGGLLADCEDCHRQEDDGSCRAAECAVPIDVSPARAAVETWLWDGRQHPPGVGKCPPAVLNAGELCDSLGFRSEENPHVGMLLDLFGSPVTNPFGQLLLLVTKQGLTEGPWGAGVAHHLVGREPSPNVIVSFSLGNRTWQEEGCAPVFGVGSRLAAAVALRYCGWRVRWRLDPLQYAVAQVPSNPRDWCLELLKRAGPDAFPELVTLGELRKHARPLKNLLQSRVWPLAIGALREGGYKGPIGFCKESPGVIREYLGIAPEQMRCNCMP